MYTKIPVSDLHRLERLLHEARDSLEAQLEELLGRSEDECGLALKEDVFGAKEEAMLAELNAGFEAESHRLRRGLVEVESALRRYADTTYGICTDCGRSIAVDRLLGQPAAVHCESCDATHQRRTESQVA